MTYYECYADEIFLLELGFKSKDMEHSLGRSRVCSKLMKDNDSFGFIDEDPGAPRGHYLELLYSTPPIYSDYLIACFEYKRNNNRLIVIKPDLESFILKVASELNIDPTSKLYNLSSTPSGLHDEIKFIKSIRKLESFKRLVKDVSTHKIFSEIKSFLNN